MSQNQTERRRRFQIGERVAMTQHGLRQGLRGRATSNFGTVTRTFLWTVWVRRNGIRHPDRYSWKFWRHLTKQERRRVS